MRSFLICVAVPPDREDINIIRDLADVNFVGSILFFIYKRSRKIMKAIEYVKSKKDVEVVYLKDYHNTTLHGDARIWEHIRDNINGEYVLFFRSTIPSIPYPVFSTDNLPNLVLSSDDPQRKRIQEFMLVNSGLIRRYEPNKDYPFVAFLEMLRDNKIMPMWAKHWATGDTFAKFPHWLYIEITTKCNLDCKYCIRDMRKGEIMDLDTFKQITSKFDKSPMTDIAGINLIGLGEVMLHPQFSEICDYIDSKGWMLTFTTNGTIYKEEIYEKLPARAEVYVSLDGTWNDGVFKQNRGISPKKVMDTIRKIRELRPKLPITIQPVIVKGFIHEAMALSDFANSVQAKLHPTLPVISNKELFDEIFPSEDEIKSIIAILKGNTQRLSNNLFDCPIHRECYDPFNLLLVLINGDVYPCCFVNTIRTQKDEYYKGNSLHVETDDYILGNIFNDSVEDIITSPVLYSVRDRISNTTAVDFDNRNDIDLEEDTTNYCRVCLGRWKRGC